ncbi:MAG TPA: tetratricopeptide repeat protein [Blastocatellia bacterium]|nr:tetratricopeptide repeat protein [Blastocatellia bacterium]
MRNGEPVALAPKVFDTLLALVESSGRLLPKDELISGLWPDTFVEEATLARNISDLRRALGELSGEDKYIETVPKSGYRFVAEVRQVEPKDSVTIIERHTRSRVVVHEEIDPEVRSIAVLPFKPLGANEGDEHLGLGLADALITRLSNIRQIAVRPTSAVVKYAGAQDPAAAGRELRVEAVLEGAIQRSWERVRLTVQLVSVSEERPLWAGKFDEMFTDIFAVEDSISEQVARALTLRLTGEERKLLGKRYTENTQAYELYLKGRYYWNKRTADGLEKSLECFRDAIDIDSSYALAYAGLADAYTLLGDVGLTAILPREAFSKARKSAIKALEIDQTLAEARASLGHIHMHCYEWAEARRELQRAIELNPNYAHARQLHGFYLAFNGRIEEAGAEMDRALRLDPLSLPINTDVGAIHYFAREYDQAIDQYRKTVELDSNFDRAHFWLGAAYEQKQRYEEAIAEYTIAIELSRGSLEAHASLGHAYARAGRRDEALLIFEELNRDSSSKYVSPYDLAIINLGMGETEAAINWLDRACDEHAGWMIYLTVDPRLDAISSDARFKALLQRVGFEAQ